MAALTAEPHVPPSLPTGRQRTATRRLTDPAHRQTDGQTDRQTPLRSSRFWFSFARRPPRGGRAPGPAPPAEPPGLRARTPLSCRSPPAPPGAPPRPRAAGTYLVEAGPLRDASAASSRHSGRRGEPHSAPRPARGHRAAPGAHPRCAALPSLAFCRSRPLLRPAAAAWGRAGRRHPPPPAPPPGRAAEEAAAWARGRGSGRGGKWWPGRAEGAGTGAMRLLRALRRCAAPGSIPQQVDFYSRFSPSPLSMKQFLDFGESPPGSPRPGPSAGCRAPRCPRAFVPLRGRARSEPLGPLGSAACPRRPVSAKRCPVWHEEPRLPSWRREPS